jgi:hypothetical protein
METTIKLKGITDDERDAAYFVCLLMRHGASLESAVLEAANTYWLMKRRVAIAYNKLVEPLPPAEHKKQLDYQLHKYSLQAVRMRGTQFCQVVNKYNFDRDDMDEGLYMVNLATEQSLHIKQHGKIRRIGFIGVQSGNIVLELGEDQRIYMGNVYIEQGDQSLFSAAYTIAGWLDNRYTDEQMVQHSKQWIQAEFDNMMNQSA